LERGKIKKRVLEYSIVLLLFVIEPSLIMGEVTYSLNLDGVDEGIVSQITSSVEEAVSIYNQHGSFNKHLNVYYNSGVPTVNASYNGVITFGASRSTRATMHSISHTMGIGTYTPYSDLMNGGVWQGFYGQQRAIEMESPYADGLHGDSLHFWPRGLNFESEDSYTERIKHVRIVASMRCDMGIASFAQEPISQVVPLGDVAVFTVVSPTAESYQWYRAGIPLINGDNITGATTSNLQIANVDLNDVGNYYCHVVGAEEILNSRFAELSIIPEPATLSLLAIGGLALLRKQK
jgi:hypothetical protein